MDKQLKFCYLFLTVLSWGLTEQDAWCLLLNSSVSIKVGAVGKSAETINQDAIQSLARAGQYQRIQFARKDSQQG